MKDKYYKGVAVGLLLENLFLLVFLIIVSSQDEYSLLGLSPIWTIMLAFTGIGIYFLFRKESSSEKEVTK